MALSLRDDDKAQIRELLKEKHLKISAKEIETKVHWIVDSQEVFPMKRQLALLVQLLHNYERSKKKEVILLEELDNLNGEVRIPATIIMGIAAKDWPGMSNAVLSIVHHEEHNVSFMKGFTVKYSNEKVAVLLLCFLLNSFEEYDLFFHKKKSKEMMKKIRGAAQGTSGKFQFLEDEAIKFEIYNNIVKRFMEMYSNSSLIKIIEESGEILKFISSRSREYLEERSIKILADLIINQYIYQNMIRSGIAEEVIKIKNFKTIDGQELTGISFVCMEGWFSVEDFLMTLNHIVPDHIIKHHKSFVTVDRILVYRIEIVDRFEKPLNASMIKTVEKSLEKLVTVAHGKKFAAMKAIGGFEHYARAIIPFLSQELVKTGTTQVFLDVVRRTQFLINIKLVLVSLKSKKKRIHQLSSKVCLIPGVTITSVIPTKCHGDKEVNILRLKVNLSEFSSIKEIYSSIKDIIKKVYGDIRDFDEGFRDIYINILGRLLEELKTVNPSLVREIFFNIDELYRIEMSFQLMKELILLCAYTVDKTKKKPDEKVIFKFKDLKTEHRTIVVVSYEMQKRLMSKLIKELEEVELYFTKIEWNQRSYLLMVLSKDKEVVDREFIERIKECINHFL